MAYFKHRGGGGKFRGRGRPGQVQPSMPVPKEGEVIGTVAKSLGAANFSVRCSDNNERVCSIPGKFKRRFWVKENDIVLIKPWSVEGDKRGDIIWRYSIMDRDRLKQAGYTIP